MIRRPSWWLRQARSTPPQSPTAIVTGWGAELDIVCENLRASYNEVWKIANEALAYPNAELVRKALVSVLPPGSILLAPHSHFGVDLSPGLSIKMNVAFVSDVVDIEGVRGSSLKLVRQEFGGQVSAHVRCDISSGAVTQHPSWRFKPLAGDPRRWDRDRQIICCRFRGGRAALSRNGVRRNGRRGYHQAACAGFDRPRDSGTGECGDRPGVWPTPWAGL